MLIFSLGLFLSLTNTYLGNTYTKYVHAHMYLHIDTLQMQIPLSLLKCKGKLF